MQVENRDLLHIRVYLGCLVGVVMVLILKELKTIFIPLALAVLLYFLFNGVMDRLLKWRVPRALGLVFLLVFLFVLCYFFGLLIYTGASAFINKFPAYSQTLARMLNSLFEQLRMPVVDVERFIADFDWSKSINTITSMLSSTLGSFAVFLGNLFLIIVFLMFMLAGRTAMEGRVGRAFATRRAVQMLEVLRSIEDKVQHYLLLKTLISLLTAVVGAGIMWLAGIDFVLFFALVIFLFNFIPNIGSIMATILPVLVGFLKFGLTLRVLLLAVGLSLTQMIIGNVVEPKVTGDNLDLSPIVILVSLILWGWMWGVIGMLLAVPLTVAIKIMMEQSPVLKPFSELMGAARPPL
ncbi:MAG TPA: AI-2E family transporter [Candidatus Aminicenantes bacterium]|nr:AI-2E family transporter [Candidatus Aminicenantes bacterium]